MKKLSIGFHPNVKRKNVSNGKTQIVMRVILNGIKKEVRLPDVYDLSEADQLKWNPTSQRLDSKTSDVNDYLNAIISRRKSIDLRTDSKPISLNEVIDELLGSFEIKNEIAIYDYAKRYLREEVENSSKKIGTKKNYRNAINQFCIFLELKGWSKLPIKDFKFEKANLFKKFLETPLENLEVLGISKTECVKKYAAGNQKVVKKKTKALNVEGSSSTKVKNIRPVFEKAINEELIISNPFKKVKLSFIPEEPANALTMPMLKRIVELENLNNGLIYTKDLFLFMCFTGFSYVDMINFKSTEFEITDNGVTLLDTKKRVKTGFRIKQILSNEAGAIMSKYFNSGFGNYATIFPHESLESLNRKLKVIQSIADIPYNLITKCARLTFKFIARQSGITNDVLVKNLMGWKSPRTMEGVYDRFFEADFIDAKNRIDSYLKSQGIVYSYFKK